MPWFSIFMAILTFFLSGGTKKENRTRALIAAGLVGAGSYYLTHNTEWGQRNLGEFDGVVKPVTGGEITNPNNPNNKIPAPTGTGTSIWDVLRNWGASGTAAVIGTGAAAATGNIMPWLLIGGVILLLMK